MTAISDDRRFQPAAVLPERADDPAIIMTGSGVTVSFDELERGSRRLGRALMAAGLGVGDVVAVLMENQPRYFEVMLACQRLGMYSVPVNWHLQADEVEYIVSDCGASALVTSAQLSGLVSTLSIPDGSCAVRVMVDADASSIATGFVTYDEFVDGFDDGPFDPGVETEGSFMFYSSGTTGRPKGIKRPLSGLPFGAGPMSTVPMLEAYYGMSSSSVYLCPAPLYHAAPLVWSTGAHRLGATVVVMERFDPVALLSAIEKFSVTHAQFVPTHFVRMLKLDDVERAKFDVSSLTMAVHAAAPCPVDVKHKMIEWWGPIIHEYYAGSEATGACLINSHDWLAHPGSVGRPLTGAVHITDDDGNELPAGEAGIVWFETDMVFEYHNDPAKTAAAFNDRGWNALGDIGYLDEDGYLFLTDRASHMIISGGVNIYPQEVESALTLHPWVADIAVIGVPNADLGEEVKAVVVTSADAPVDESEVERGLISYARERIAHYKCPVSVDVVSELPRLPTGKLLKRQLRDRYWPAR